MSQDEPTGPDLAGVIADANAVGLKYVVIGGFSVVFHGYIRATRDSDLLVPDGAETDQAVLRLLERVGATSLSDGGRPTADEVARAHHLRVHSRHGIIDIMRGGLPPLDYDTVAERAETLQLRGHSAPIASLRSVVGFKRLAQRQDPDRNDLRHLEAIHGPLPIEAIPGLDT